jgi:hypothetical protein
VVARGKVVRKKVLEIKGHLWTDARVRVIESLKGKLPGGHELSLRQPGGETKAIGERVAGAAQFTVGEEVLVFARPVESYYVPVGMCLGKFRIVRSSKGETKAERDLSGVAFGMFDLQGKFHVLESEPHSNTSKKDSRALSQLVATVKQHLKMRSRRVGRRSQIDSASRTTRGSERPTSVPRLLKVKGGAR